VAATCNVVSIVPSGDCCFRSVNRAAVHVFEVWMNELLAVNELFHNFE